MKTTLPPERLCCLQLDVGNSSAKWRLCRAGELLARGRYIDGDEDSRSALLDCAREVDEIWIASVAGPSKEGALRSLCAQRWGVEPWFARSQAESAGLRNSYEQPARMGVDRWLAMLAAWQRKRDRVCVIDAGSALTIDLVDADGQHEGGYIIPGAALMERALLLDTDRVRFAEDADYRLNPGKSTAEAVRHGIAVAQVGAVAAVASSTREQPAGLVFCGGGGKALMELADCGGELVPDLVFEGLEIMRGLRGDA